MRSPPASSLPSTSRARPARRELVFAAALLASLTARCETYDPPPRPYLVGLVNGVLPDPKQVLEVAFSEPVDPATLRARLMRVETDTEGNLFDEDADPTTTPDVFLDYPYAPVPPAEGEAPVEDVTVAVLSEDRRILRLRPKKVMPIGPRLAVVIEAGLSDDAGNRVRDRQRLTFGFELGVAVSSRSKIFVEGTYFMLVDVKKPLSAQVQLFAKFRLNDDGTFAAQFTNADRKTGDRGCPTACRASEVCRLLPAADCVPPSERAGDPSEHSDYYPFPTPPAGYSFPVKGIVQDEGTAAVMQADPVDVVVQQPPVTLQAARFTGAFEKQADGSVLASGSLAAPTVLLNGKPLGSSGGEGSFRAVLVPPNLVPPDVPSP